AVTRCQEPGTRNQEVSLPAWRPIPDTEAPTACRHPVSGTVSPRSSRCFSPFPHGTGTLSVTEEYLGLEGGPPMFRQDGSCPALLEEDRKSTRLNSSHRTISYAVFCLKKKT